VPLTSTTSASPLAAHVAGMVVYNTATISDVTPGLYVNTGAVWEKQVGATNINGLIDAKTDAESIFLGGGAGFQDNGLNSNTGVGINTLYSVTSGADNVGIGYQASPHTQTTSNNTVIGSNANKLNFGSDNVSVGSYAGYQANGSGNVLLGNHAGYFSSSSTLNNKLYIENSASATPLIYGEFDTNLARINGNFEVTGTVNVGTGGDLEIYHDGSVSSYVKAPTGVLNLQSNDLRLGAANGESYLRGIANSSTSLYFNNVSKLSTLSNGVSVTGEVVSDGLSIGDGDIINVGNGDDLKIWHDGSVNSYINSASAILNLQANDVRLMGTNSELYFRGVVNSSAYMYWNNLSKLQTTSAGVSITGTATATSVVADIQLGTTKKIYGGTSTNNYQFYSGDIFYQYHNGYQRFTMADTYTRFNVNQVDVDFIVSSVGMNGMFKVDAGTNTVGINTSSPNAAYSLHNAGTTLLTGTVDTSGTVNHAGYTKLGEAATAIKTVMYTGTTAATEGGAVQLNMAEVRGHKIISITVNVEYADGAVVPQNYTQIAGYEFEWRTSNYYILIYNDSTNSQTILSKTWTAYVTYGV